MADPVVIADYDPSWPATFQQLRDRLAATLGQLAVAIEHVGLYVCAIGTLALDRHLALRDALRADLGAADAYGDLKRSLAAQLGDDRAGYTEAKSAFIEQILAAVPEQP